MSIIFSKKLKNDNDTLFERALLTIPIKKPINDYLYRVNSNYTFGTLHTQISSWREKIFQNLDRVNAIESLLSKVEIETLNVDLEIICKNYQERDWKYEIINHPKAITYSLTRMIRFNSENDIRILWKSQLSGNHVELFSYCLHSEIEDARIAPIIKCNYHNGIGYSKRPFGEFKLEDYRNKNYIIHLHYNPQKHKKEPYELKFYLDKSQDKPFTKDDYSDVNSQLEKSGFNLRDDEANTKFIGYWASAQTKEIIKRIFTKLAQELKLNA